MPVTHPHVHASQSKHPPLFCSSDWEMEPTRCLPSLHQVSNFLPHWLAPPDGWGWTDLATTPILARSGSSQLIQGFQSASPTLAAHKPPPHHLASPQEQSLGLQGMPSHQPASQPPSSSLIQPFPLACTWSGCSLLLPYLWACIHSATPTSHHPLPYWFSSPSCRVSTDLQACSAISLLLYVFQASSMCPRECLSGRDAGQPGSCYP